MQGECMFKEEELKALDELEAVLKNGLDLVDKLRGKEKKSDHARMRKLTTNIAKLGKDFRKWSVARCKAVLTKKK